MFKKFFIVIIVGMLPTLGFSTCKKITTYEIATGSEKGTYYQIGLNLAKYIAPSACIKLKAINTNGSLDNVFKLISPKYPKLKFAIVQNDVLEELKRLADGGDRLSKKLVENLRVVKALYNEEIHIISKKGSDIRTFGDLKGKIISVGTTKSGTAMTSTLLYKSLFEEELERFKFQTFKKGLLSLETGEVDAVVKVAGEPFGELSELPSIASEAIQLLSYDVRNIEHNPVTTYYDAEIMGSSYLWMNVETPTLSTKAYLVTYNYPNEPTRGNIKRFSKSINSQISELQNRATKSIDTPHLKWKEVSVECDTELPGSWEYYIGAKNACLNRDVPRDVPVESVNECTEYKRKLGFCS